MPGQVLVKHYRLHPNSSDVDSGSVKYQYYEPAVYDEFIRENEKEAKQNNFIRMGLKTDVIYNPTRDENGIATDVKPKAEAPKPEPKVKAAPKAKAVKKVAEAPKPE